MSLGETMMNWLRSVDKDQNLQGIGDLTSTSMSDRVRRWFRRQDLTPTLKHGEYNHHTGKYELTGEKGDSEFTTASAAALTLTVPANHRYIATHARARNATQATTVTMSASIGGNTLTLSTSPSGTAFSTLLGVSLSDISAVGYSLETPITLEAGDSLTLTCNTYAGGNDTEHFIIFRDRVIA